MLSAPDADLSLRDPDLPGLPLLLDPVALGQELAQHSSQVQDDSMDLTATYLRYKPGTSCLAAYRIELAGTKLDLYAKAFRPAAWDKLRKGFDRPAVPAPHPLDAGPGRILLPNLAIVLRLFPNDKRLKSLARLGTADSRRTLLQRVFRAHPELWSADVHTVSYKPERRYVGQALLGEESRAVLKFYTEGGYRAAKVNAKGFNSRGLLRIATQLGHSDRHRILSFEWVCGQLLANALYSSQLAPGDVQNVGAALAELHAQKPKRLYHLTRRVEIDALLTMASWLGFVYPPVAEQARHLTASLAERLEERPQLCRPIHGDFYAKQVLLNSNNVCILDLDEAVLSDPAADLGLFMAHMERDVLYGKLANEVIEPVREAMLEGYRANGGQQVTDGDVALYTAIGLLKLAPHPFRTRQPEWPQQIDTILQKAEELLKSNAPHVSGYR